MQLDRLTSWVAGALAGCPGTVDAATPVDAPVDDGLAPAYAREGRSAWVTAAAIIMVVEGGLGIWNAPVLADSSLGLLHPLFIIVVGLSAVSVAAGIGLLFLRGWARLAAGALSSLALLAMYAPALVVAVSGDGWRTFDWLGFVGYLIVLYAVLRRWPER